MTSTSSSQGKVGYSPRRRITFLVTLWSALCLLFFLAEGREDRILPAAILWAAGLAFLVLAARQTGRGDPEPDNLRGQLARERGMFLAGPVITFNWRNEEDWPVDSVSPNVTDLLGYTPDELVSGRVPFSRLVHPEDLTRVVQEMVCFCGQDQESFSHEPYRLVARDGSVLWFHDQTSAFRDETGRVTHYVGYLIDITQSRTLAAELADHRDRLELVIDGADLGTWEWNIATGDVQFNERWGGMLGLRPHEVVSDLSTWEKVVHPDDMAEIQDVLTRHLEGDIPEYRTEHRLRHRDGRWVWVLDVGRVYERDKEGNPLKAAGIHLDITHAKETERKLRKANQELSGALAEVHALRGIIPICAGCKKIRDDEGFWVEVEKYISSRIEGDFSHGLCPDCTKTFYPELEEGAPGPDTPN